MYSIVLSVLARSNLNNIITGRTLNKIIYYDLHSIVRRRTAQNLGELVYKFVQFHAVGFRRSYLVPALSREWHRIGFNAVNKCRYIDVYKISVRPVHKFTKPVSSAIVSAL